MLFDITVLTLALVASVSSQGIAGKCTGQSCYIASLSTSTEEPYTLKNGKKPSGGDPSGDKCIKSYYQKLGLPPPAGLRRFARGAAGENPGSRPQDSSDTIKDYLLEKRATLSTRAEDAPAADCKPNAMIFAKGTLEPGIMGSTVGPALKTALGAGWESIGVDYSNSMAGIQCIGMPGGYIAKGVTEKLNERCPKTNIILAGYSQGAMVVRFAAAWANPATKQQIKGLLLYGDPFNGATVKGIPQTKIKTLCNDSDGVCKGQLSIGAGHLSYTANGAVGQGATWAKKMVAGGA